MDARELERFNAPREMTAWRIEGEVSQAESMSRVQEGAEDVVWQNELKAWCSVGERDSGGGAG